MKTIKTKKYTHSNENTPYTHDGTKEERKEGRKLMKSIRHKLLMNIPLTDTEQHLADEFHISKDYKLNTNNDARIYNYYRNINNAKI